MPEPATRRSPGRWASATRRCTAPSACRYRKCYPDSQRSRSRVSFRMAQVLRVMVALLTWWRRSPAQREAEILYLRQQLIVLKRSNPARPRLMATDRLIFVCLYRLFPSLLDASIIFKPETLLRWHRIGFRLFWRWKSRRRTGRPAGSADLRSLARRISRENPLWGAPRIHGELLKLGIEIAQSTVAKYMVRRRGPPSQGW